MLFASLSFAVLPSKYQYWIQLATIFLFCFVSYKVTPYSNGIILGICYTINNILIKNILINNVLIRKKVQTKVKKSPVASWRSFFNMGRSSTTAKRKVLRHTTEPNNMKTSQALAGRVFPIHNSLFSTHFSTLSYICLFYVQIILWTNPYRWFQQKVQCRILTELSAMI